MKLKTVLLSLFTLAMFLSHAQATTQNNLPIPEQQIQVTEQVQPPAVIGDKININTATASELQKALIGIGAKKAQAIVHYRETHGKFIAIEQLLEVQGIGKATLEKNRERIML